MTVITPFVVTENPLGGFAVTQRWRLIEDRIDFTLDDDAAQTPYQEQRRRFDRAARMLVRNFDLNRPQARAFLDSEAGHRLGMTVTDAMWSGLDFDAAFDMAIAARWFPLPRRQNARDRLSAVGTERAA